MAILLSLLPFVELPHGVVLRRRSLAVAVGHLEVIKPVMGIFVFAGQLTVSSWWALPHGLW